MKGISLDSTVISRVLYQKSSQWYWNNLHELLQFFLLLVIRKTVFRQLWPVSLCSLEWNEGLQVPFLLEGSVWRHDYVRYVACDETMPRKIEEVSRRCIATRRRVFFYFVKNMNINFSEQSARANRWVMRWPVELDEKLEIYLQHFGYFLRPIKVQLKLMASCFVLILAMLDVRGSHYVLYVI